MPKAKGKRIKFVLSRIDVIHNTNLTAVERLLLFSLLSWCNPPRDGGEFICWPSSENMATSLGFSISHILRSLRSLEAKGFLSRMIEKTDSGDRRVIMLNRKRVSCEGMAEPHEARATPTSHNERKPTQELTEAEKADRQSKVDALLGRTGRTRNTA